MTIALFIASAVLAGLGLWAVIAAWSVFYLAKGLTGEPGSDGLITLAVLAAIAFVAFWASAKLIPVVVAVTP